MGKWINKNETTPILKKMLVFCKRCNNIHTVFLDYEEYCLAEKCYESGHFFTGAAIEFDFYMPLPPPPSIDLSMERIHENQSS